MRIALVSEYPAAGDAVSGGVQSVVRQLAREMARRDGLEVHAVSVEHGRREPAREELEGVRVHRLGGSRRFGNVTLGREERRATADVIRRIGPDVAHAHVLGPPALGVAEAGVPWLATAHGMQEAEGRAARGPMERVRTAARVRMERLSLRGLRHLIVISPYVERYFAERIADVVTHRIPNPVDERFFETRGRRQPGRILFAGRLIPRKDVEGLLAAAACLRRDGVAFELRLAGGAEDHTYADALRRRAEDEGVSDRVRFLGPLSPSGIAEELAQAAIFVQSSRQETASVAVAEAMATGTAVVATDVGGTLELLGDAGRIVAPGRPLELAGALRAYLEDPAEGLAAGERGRDRARHGFRVGPIVDRTLAVYQQVLATAPDADKALD